MANNKKVNKNLKSNRKCEHCKHYSPDKHHIYGQNFTGFCCAPECLRRIRKVNYWNCCANFEWAEGEKYETD